MDFPRIGIFTIGKRMPGAPLATFHLVFTGGRVTGSGQVTQAVSPPLRVETYLSGTSAEIVWGADEQLNISLNGHEFPTVMPPNPMNVECSIALDSNSNGKDGGKSTANLRYLDAGGNWKELRDQPVAVAWLPLSEQ